MNIKVVIAIFLTSLSGSLFAQFNSADFGKLFNCTIILKSGETKNLNVRYQHPDFLKSANHPLETENEGYINKRDIETFFIKNQCWVERQTPSENQWVILSKQGAIEHVIYIMSESKGTKPTIMSGEFISKNGVIESSTTLMLGYKKKMNAFVSDYPELVKKVSDGEKGYGFVTYLLVVDEYNTWYDKANPDKIAYYPWFNRGDKNALKLAEVKQVIQQTKDSVANAKKEFAASRPATVAPEIASIKANIPPKKESFTAKVKRYETEGHKIAVVMQQQKTKLRAIIRGTNANPKDVGFNDQPEAPLIDERVLPNTVSELNRIYKTTIFEAVSLSQIPLTELKPAQPVDDWWGTRYKTVVYLQHLREYTCNNDMMVDGSFEGTASIGLYANVIEYLDDGKNETDFLKRLYVFAFGNSDPFKYSNGDWPITFESLEAKVDWLKVQQRYDKKRQDQVAKLAEKWD